MPHVPTAADLQLSKLNLELLDTDDPAKRTGILDKIYTPRARNERLSAREHPLTGFAPGIGGEICGHRTFWSNTCSTIRSSMP